MGRKKSNQRSQTEILQHRAAIAELYLSGATQMQIADELGVSQATISRDIKAIHEAWRESALVDFDDAKARELARIDKLEREAWDAWEDSKQARKRVTATSKGGKGFDTDNARVVTENQSGDPRFLNQIERCIKLRVAIFGLETKHVDLTTLGKEIQSPVILPATDITQLEDDDSE